MNLEEMLKQRAEEARLTPATLGRVQGRARAIRRRRAATAVAGTIAGVAAVAAVAVVAIPGSTDSARNIGIAQQSTTASQSPPPSPSTSVVPAQPGQKPTVVNINPQNVEQTWNGSPSSGYWQQGTLFAPNGDATQVGDVVSFGFSAQGNGNGWIYAKQGGPTGYTITDTEFGDAPMETTAPDIAVTSDATFKAYLAEITDPQSGQQSWAIREVGGPMQGGGHTWALDGQPSAGSGVLGIVEGDGVIATVDGHLRFYDNDGTVKPLADSYETAGLSDDGWAAVQDKNAGTCSAGTAADTMSGVPVQFIRTTDLLNGDRPAWGLCPFGEISFSPDGKYVAAFTLDPSHAGPGGLVKVSIWDVSKFTATSPGQPAVADFAAPAEGAFSPSVAWDKDRLVVPTFETDQWALVWLAPNGTWQVGRSSQKFGGFQEPPYKMATGQPPAMEIQAGD